MQSHLKLGWHVCLSAMLCLSLCACANTPPTVAQGLALFDDGDYPGARRTLTELANKGDANAQQVLGIMYENGQGMTADLQQALKWYRLAANSDNASAQYHLGRLYATGSGVPRSPEQSLKWYRLAAANSQPNAQYQLGMMSLQGNGLTQDPQTAAKWFALAASQGDPLAQYQLGDMLTKGLGTRQDVTLGYMWLDIARGLGEPAAIQATARLEKQISVEQRLQAENMSLQCIKQSYQDCGGIARPRLGTAP